MGEEAAAVQLSAWPGIRPIGRSTVGAGGDRDDEIDAFKGMVHDNSDDEQWLADAPAGYIANALAGEHPADAAFLQ